MADKRLTAVVHFRCDRGVIWWLGAGVGGDTGLLCPAKATRADSSTEHRVVQPAAVAARHRLHLRPRTSTALIRISVIVSAAAAAAAGDVTLPQSKIYDTQQQRPTVFVHCGVRVISWWTKQYANDADSLSHFAAIYFTYAPWYRTPLVPLLVISAVQYLGNLCIVQTETALVIKLSAAKWFKVVC